jgi:GT2 family glycosyltransferase
MKTTIGIATYNGADRVKLLLSSIDNYTSDAEKNDISIVVCDDGTPYVKNTVKLVAVCNKFNAELIRHEENRGISATWNTLSQATNSDLIILLNDDIQISHYHWLRNLKYFFEHNNNIGHVSYQILQMDPRTGMLKSGYAIPDITCLPQFSMTPGGQAFAFLRSAYNSLEKGFREELKAFYEESWFGYEVSDKGFYSYIIPFPAMQHLGSQTFALNEELAFMIPDENILSMHEYRELLSSKFLPEKIEPRLGKVYRMEYSRVLFARHWGCKDIFDKPQDEVEDRLKSKFTQRVIYWLDCDNNERKKLI